MDERTAAGQADGAVRPRGHWAKVWDAPTRLFHWSLVALVATSYVTARMGRIDWHFYSGYAILALVLFRIGWGVAGSQTARFAGFIRGPGAALAHLREVVRRAPVEGAPRESIGHNAAGGLMVAALLILLLLQAGSGLFANDGLFEQGPLAGLAGPAWSDSFSAFHALAINLLLAAIAVHVGAVLLYALLLRQDLIRPMITGWKRLPPGLPAPQLAPLWRAAVIAAVAAGIVVGLSRLS